MIVDRQILHLDTINFYLLILSTACNIITSLVFLKENPNYSDSIIIILVEIKRLK